MKKLISLAALLFGMFGNAMADDTVVPTIHGAETAKTWTLTVGLNNANDYVAFQMDVQLPAGVSADAITVRDRLKDGGSVTINGETLSTNFSVEKNVIDEANNIVRIIGYNYGNHNVVNSANQFNDGMFKVALSSTEAIGTKTIAATIKNALFVKKDKSTQELSGADLVVDGSSLAVTNGLAGDANGDGVINATDAVAVINRYLGQPLSGKFDGKAADINGDEVFNASDAVAIINAYLNSK